MCFSLLSCKSARAEREGDSSLISCQLLEVDQWSPRWTLKHRTGAYYLEPVQGIVVTLGTRYSHSGYQEYIVNLSTRWFSHQSLWVPGTVTAADTVIHFVYQLIGTPGTVTLGTKFWDTVYLAVFPTRLKRLYKCYVYCIALTSASGCETTKPALLSNSATGYARSCYRMTSGWGATMVCPRSKVFAGSGGKSVIHLECSGETEVWTEPAATSPLTCSPSTPGTTFIHPVIFSFLPGRDTSPVSQEILSKEDLDNS